MSQFYDSASLVMIPSGIKDGKVYSQKPLSTDGQLTFSRGADVEATRVNSQGLIEKAKVNLLLQSNTFNTTWSPSASITVTSGQSGYDGTNNAWLLKRSDTSARYISQTKTLSNGVYSFSVYAKAESEEWLFLWTYNGSASKNAYFHLTGAGSVGSFMSADGATIQSVGGGWYRCTIFYSDPVQSVRIYPAVADGNITGGITDAGIYIQDAQLNYGLVAQDYVETTSAAVVSGITNDMPRLNYDPANPTCPHLILEGSRTNLVTQSEYIADSSWSKVRNSITTNSALTLDPTGNYSSTLVTQDAVDTNGGAFYRFFTFTAAAHTYSVFAKMNEIRYINLAETASAAGTHRTWFDLQSGTVGTKSPYHTAKIEAYSNGWYRCSITFTAVSGSYSVLNYLSGADNSTAAPVSKGAFFYGCQLELGSYGTSLIPTYGTSATRTADACSKTGISSLIGQTEGTLFAEFTYEGNISGALEISPLYVGTGTYATAIYIDIYQGKVYAIVFNGGVNQASINGGSLSEGIHKVAIAYANNDIVLYLDGAQIGSDTSVTIPSCDRVYLGTVGTSTQLQKYQQHQALLFKTRLSNADLATLTSL